MVYNDAVIIATSAIASIVAIAIAATAIGTGIAVIAIAIDEAIAVAALAKPPPLLQNRRNSKSKLQMRLLPHRRCD